MKNEGGQLATTISFGTDDEGKKVKETLEKAAIELGYKTSKRGSGIGTMIREMALWIVAHGVWVRGKGMIDLKGGDDAKSTE